MAGKIEKYITSKADFEAGIVQKEMTPYSVDGLITMKQDLQYGAALSPLWSISALVPPSTLTYDNPYRGIVLSRASGAGNNVAMVSAILPATYEIYFKWGISTGAGSNNYSIGGIGVFGGGTQYLRIYFYVSITNQLHIRYYSDAATKHEWDGSAWQVTDQTCGTATAGFCRIKKDATNFIITIYDTSNVVISTATIAIASVWDLNAYFFDRFLTGDVVDFAVAANQTYVISLWDIYGIHCISLLGNFSAILDLGRQPILKGSYAETMLSNWYDEEYGLENKTDNIGLRNSAATEMLSQEFQIRKDGIINKVRFAMASYGLSGSEKVWVEIYTDDGTANHYPSAPIASCVSDVVLASNIRGAGVGDWPTWIEFSFSAATVTLNKLTRYHLVIKGDYTIGANYICLGIKRVAGYANGTPHNYNSGWTNGAFPAEIEATSDFVFGVKLIETSLIDRYIAYENDPTYKTLSSKADFEGNNEVSSQIDTATIAGTVRLALDPLNPPNFYASGYIQNDIDLGKVPDNFCTFSAIYTLGMAIGLTTLVFKIASSDDNITFSGFTTITPAANDTVDLTALGKHRYWRVKVEFGVGSNLVTPELYSWSIDGFSALTAFEIRDKILPYRYIKIMHNYLTTNKMTSVELTEIYFSFLIAYELYIKRVKYRVNADGIMADMELSSI